MAADYYQILGVSKNASDQDIKIAYRKQALQWHPDRNKSSGATDKFKEINKAYEVLSDPKKKQMYDQYGADVFEKSNAAGQPGYGGQQQGPFTYTYTNFGGQGSPFEGVDFGGFSDPFEIFEQFFGFNSPFSGQSRKQKRRVVYETEITFEEAVHGIEKEVVLKGERKTIKIPAGVDTGNRIRFSDFDLQVKVKTHRFFKREGQDIYIEKEISYPRAVLGGVIDVLTIRGIVKLEIRPGTQSGLTIRLKGEGVPYPNSSRKGDQYVIYKIKTPERISFRVKQLLEELEKEL
jgi:DnaJ-class molecular chaperone